VTDSAQDQIAGPRRRRVSILKLSAAAASLALITSLATLALASSTVTINSASNAQLKEKVLVDSQGRTLYVLSPETAKHLLCKSSECLRLWPPLTVSSSKTRLKLAPGVHGSLGIVHRSNGMLQVTLGGLPLYRFAEDHAGGEVNGQNLKGFGGTWHVLRDSGAPSSASPSATPTSTTPTTTTPGNGYEY
jgi:predicted lipoprotein with Yx(FWY)xxD motif